MKVISIKSGEKYTIQAIDAIKKIFLEGKEIMKNQENNTVDIINLNERDKTYVFGNIEGNFNILQRIAKRVMYHNPTQKYVFLGNYTSLVRQRNMDNIACLALLFYLKKTFPSNVFLIRGKNETREKSIVSGYDKEIQTRLVPKFQIPDEPNQEILDKETLIDQRKRQKIENGIRLSESNRRGHIWEYFMKCIDYMPLAVVINNQILCVHGGINPDETFLTDLNDIPRQLIEIGRAHV